MNFWGRFANPRETKTAVPVPEKREDRGLVCPIEPPLPRPPLRVLNYPMFDTVMVCRDNRTHSFFVEPVGHRYPSGAIKGLCDTNMVSSKRLADPMEFDFCRWRVEFSPDVPMKDVLAFRFNSRITFWFENIGAWVSMPLSYVPFTAFMSDDEGKQISSVFFDLSAGGKFREAWINAQALSAKNDSDMPDMPWRSGGNVGTADGIYYNEMARDITIKDRPLRLRSKVDGFWVTIETDWEKVKFSGKLGVRVILEGVVYAAI